MKKKEIIDKKKRILFFHPGLSTFVVKDIEMLKESFNLIPFEFKPDKKISTIVYFFRQFSFLFKHILSTDIIICKFAGYHSLIPIIFGKVFKTKSTLINGGTDCVSFPEINYGHFSKPLLKDFTKLTYKMVDHIITLHSSMIEMNYTYDDIGAPKQGFKYFVGNLNKPIVEIYNGYDNNQWYCDSLKKPNTFVTVAYGLGEKNKNILKGIDLINEIASAFPQCEFILVGKEISNESQSKNIIAVPPQTSARLREIFSQSEFYLQLSVSEGFPNTLCEAMLCECIPIGSNVTSIPFIIGSTGYVLMKKDKNLLKQIINEALERKNSVLRKESRRRIMNNFNIEQRKLKLTAFLNNI